MRRFHPQLHRDERGITSVETAIVLVAPIVAAAVIAFVVLTTGLFSVERGRETVFALQPPPGSHPASQRSDRSIKDVTEAHNSGGFCHFVVTGEADAAALVGRSPAR